MSEDIKIELPNIKNKINTEDLKVYYGELIMYRAMLDTIEKFITHNLLNKKQILNLIKFMRNNRDIIVDYIDTGEFKKEIMMTKKGEFKIVE